MPTINLVLSELYLTVDEFVAVAVTNSAMPTGCCAQGAVVVKTGETMAIKGAAATLPFSPGERADGLNHIAQLRAKVFGANGDAEMERFIDALRATDVTHYQQNQRALAAIFFMANIPTARHHVGLNRLTPDEKRALIKAINHFRAVVSLFPKRLTLPD